jgi:hypothetical protein
MRLDDAKVYLDDNREAILFYKGLGFARVRDRTRRTRDDRDIVLNG